MFCFVLVFEVRAGYIAQASLLPQPLGHWDYRHVASDLVTLPIHSEIFEPRHDENACFLNLAVAES